jgi:hypothetical protein
MERRELGTSGLEVSAMAAMDIALTPADVALLDEAFPIGDRCRGARPARQHAPARARAGALNPEEIAPDVVRTFRSAQHGRPEGLHYCDFFRLNYLRITAEDAEIAEKRFALRALRPPRLNVISSRSRTSR